MKYIRTKDGHILEATRRYDEEKDINYYFTKLGMYDSSELCWEIRKEHADTIEELCDEFVYKFKTGKEKPHITISVYNYDDINIVREHIKKMYDEQTKIYGAIWIKGEHGEPILKSVAILKEGGLELL